MLEALISKRPQGDKGPKKRGDVIALKLAGSPWSRRELSFQHVVEWPLQNKVDEGLWVQLLAMVSERNPHPCLVHPYARHDLDGNLLQRSTQGINIDALPAATKAAWLNIRSVQPISRADQFTRSSR